MIFLKIGLFPFAIFYQKKKMKNVHKSEADNIKRKDKLKEEICYGAKVYKILFINLTISEKFIY